MLESWWNIQFHRAAHTKPSIFNTLHYISKAHRKHIKLFYAASNAKNKNTAYYTLTITSKASLFWNNFTSSMFHTESSLLLTTHAPENPALYPEATTPTEPFDINFSNSLNITPHFAPFFLYHTHSTLTTRNIEFTKPRRHRQSCFTWSNRGYRYFFRFLLWRYAHTTVYVSCCLAGIARKP